MESIAIDLLSVSIALVFGALVFLTEARLLRHLRNKLRAKEFDKRANTTSHSTFFIVVEMLNATFDMIFAAADSATRTIVNALRSMTNHKKTGDFSAPRTQPPRQAQLLLRFTLRPSDQEAILGDMQEIYHDMTAEYGQKLAQRWYIWQALRTSFSQIFAKLAKWGIFAAIADAVRKIAAL